MPGLYLLQLFNSHENCKIQTNMFDYAHIRGGVVVDDHKSGENFCGNAGTTSGHSTYTNEAITKSASSADSSASSSAMSGGSGHHAAASKPAPPKKVDCGNGWGQTKCLQQIIILI